MDILAASYPFNPMINVSMKTRTILNSSMQFVFVTKINAMV